MASFVEELKRRNIFRVATVYAVASWVILQLADVTFPALEILEADIRYVIIALMVGFPIVIGFSWLFEITPDGLKRTGQVEATASIRTETGRKIDFVIIGLLSVALLFFMGEYFSNEDSEIVLDIVAEPVETPALTPIEKPSIAVLPLVNMSSDRENEHFADGLTEELLNVLARNPELRVAGRTSSFFYKGKNINLQEIGTQLNVTNILEGSVRKSGDTVRVTAQLINAETGFHLWSETYDREIHDIFAIQDEIANHVAKAMNLTLLANQIIPGSTTTVAEAHDLYLQAKSLLYERQRDTIEASINLFQRASELDPQYGPPLIGLAEAYLVLENNYQTIELTEAAELSKQALDRAENIGFTPSEYWSTLGLYHNHLVRISITEVDAAAAAFEKAIELNDNNINAFLWYASLLAEDSYNTQEVNSVNYLEHALQLNQMALRLDPKNRVANGNQQIHLMEMGRMGETINNLNNLIRDDPDYASYPLLLSAVRSMQGDLTEASRLLSDTPGIEARKSFITLRILWTLNEEPLLHRFFDQISHDNPSYELMETIRTSRHAPAAELIAKAQVALLQPDLNGWSRPIASSLYLKGEFEWSRKLQENINQEWSQETPRFSINSRDIAQYICTLFLAGDQERATMLAEQALTTNKKRLRVTFRGKFLDDAMYYMVLNRPEEAITEIESAYADGYRHYYFDVYQNPIFLDIVDDPRIVNVRKKTDEHLAAHREAVEQNLMLAGLLTPLPTVSH
ncbi:MAG: TolB-like protein [Candidatus Azotimanducaceae bacterium]